jgi:hypothetical protein
MGGGLTPAIPEIPPSRQSGRRGLLVGCEIGDGRVTVYFGAQNKAQQQACLKARQMVRAQEAAGERQEGGTPFLPTVRMAESQGASARVSFRRGRSVNPAPAEQSPAAASWWGPCWAPYCPD